MFVKDLLTIVSYNLRLYYAASVDTVSLPLPSSYSEVAAVTIYMCIRIYTFIHNYYVYNALCYLPYPVVVLSIPRHELGLGP